MIRGVMERLVGSACTRFTACHYRYWYPGAAAVSTTGRAIEVSS
jgi:hypothetical protein